MASEKKEKTLRIARKDQSLKFEVAKFYLTCLEMPRR